MYETYLPSPSLKALVQHVVNAWLHISPNVVISHGAPAKYAIRPSSQQLQQSCNINNKSIPQVDYNS